MHQSEDLPWPDDPVVPADFSQPSPRYKRLVVQSAVVFVAFLAAWGGLTGWLAFLVYRAIAGIIDGTGTGTDIIMALPAGFLCLVLGRGLLQVHRAPFHEGRVEIDTTSEPVLMAFIHQIADRVGAPRPRRVFLEPHVNAAVVQDVHLASLIIPRGRDLVIGLGLVNVLSLDEFKAVIAHEFGHFSQKAMGMGRWVYTAQVFVRELVYARGALDRFLQVISRVDIRIAWIGWVMRLVVWSIRAIFEQAWRWVTRMQLALTREMEHHADMVAASVAGCDSPVHALHKAMAGDRAYAAAISLAESRFNRVNKRVEDLYAIQTAQLELHRDISGDPSWGRRPDGCGSAEFRVFPLPLAQRPEMWSTHPPNHDREAVIKARYVASSLDDRSAWCLFTNPAARREELTRHALPGISNNLDSEPTAESLASLDEVRSRPRFNRRYRGLYLKRGLTRMRRSPDDLIGTIGAGERDPVLARLDALYPQSVEDRLERFGVLTQEREQLQSIHEGWARPPGGVVVFRGEHLKNKEVKPRLDTLEKEWKDALEAIFEDFREARAAHLAAARLVGRGWRDYLEGLLAIIHYCEHMRARIEEATEVFGHELHIVLADGQVTQNELRRLRNVGNDLHREILTTWEQRNSLQPGAGALERFGQESWASLFGSNPPLHPPTDADFAQGWHQSAFNTANALMSAFHDLAGATTDELLAAEDKVAEALRSETPIGRAPAHPRTPDNAPRKAFDDDALHLRKMPLWERFVNADGPLPAVARFSAAAAVLAPALYLTGTVGTSELVVYNGLADPMLIQIDDLEAVVDPGDTFRTNIEAGPHHLQAHNRTGRRIEAIDVDLAHRGSTALWNIAGAGMMVRWTAAYGTAQPQPERLVVPKSWTIATVDFLFETPPESIQMSGSGAVRSVLEGVPSVPYVLDSPLIPGPAGLQVAEAHARHDALDSMWFGMWFDRLSDDSRAAIYTDRDGDAHGRLVRLTWPEDDAHPACADLDITASIDHSPGQAYLATRCSESAHVAEQAFTRWPDDPMVGFASASWLAQRGDYSGACTRILQHHDALQWVETPVPIAAFSFCRLADTHTPVRFAALLHDQHNLKSIVSALHTPPPADSDPILLAMRAIHDNDDDTFDATLADLADHPTRPILVHAHAISHRLRTGDLRHLERLAARYGPPTANPYHEDLEILQLGVLLATGGDTDAFLAAADNPLLTAHLDALRPLLDGDRAPLDAHLATTEFYRQATLATAAAAIQGPDTPTDLQRLAAFGQHPVLAPALPQGTAVP